MNGPDLTLREAAEELGVHYMTAYRYVRLGLLDASKSGGTWRVTADALEQFRRPASAVSIEGRVSVGRRAAPWSERLESRLMAGDARGAWSVFESAQASGADPSALYLDVLSPALVSIGERWERGEIDVSVEHRASGVAMRLIGRLGPRFSRRGRNRGCVILGAPEGERHALPLAIVGDLLRLQGWEVTDLGADVPTGSFVYALREQPEAIAVGLSVTTSAGLDAAAAACAVIRQTAASVCVVIGGPAVTDGHQARALGADAWADSAAAFTNLLNEQVFDTMR